MPIPESQLETWAHQGAIVGSRDTYRTVREALTANTVPYHASNYDVFLQGSYGNDTNIWAESDVDIVIQSKDFWYRDLELLSEPQKVAYNAAHSDAIYTYQDFKRDVLAVLRDRFGNDADPGDKAITIRARGDRRKCDVIAAATFRRYIKFNSLNDQAFDEGICFFNARGERIVNYPKYHSTNLTTQNIAANGRLKPMVRILKNIRSILVERGAIESGIAPSYFIEGLLYNVPSGLFAARHEDTFVSAMQWLLTDADKPSLVCANEQHYLLRDGAHTCWPRENCDQFINAVVNLWNEW